eukprot:GEMP01022418.1.p1 GENE.GEMP01022418.1~~GEMP01022418.1.p1  ORF type:complete len:421 (+),score=51.20 GEMP01022418.1:175-1437(+)
MIPVRGIQTRRRRRRGRPTSRTGSMVTSVHDVTFAISGESHFHRRSDSSLHILVDAPSSTSRLQRCASSAYIGLPQFAPPAPPTCPSSPATQRDSEASPHPTSPDAADDVAATLGNVRQNNQRSDARLSHNFPDAARRVSKSQRNVGQNNRQSDASCSPYSPDTGGCVSTSQRSARQNNRLSDVRLSANSHDTASGVSTSQRNMRQNSRQQSAQSPSTSSTVTRGRFVTAPASFEQHRPWCPPPCKAAPRSGSVTPPINANVSCRGRSTSTTVSERNLVRSFKYSPVLQSTQSIYPGRRVSSAPRPDLQESAKTLKMHQVPDNVRAVPTPATAARAASRPVSAARAAPSPVSAKPRFATPPGADSYQALEIMRLKSEMKAESYRYMWLARCVTNLPSAAWSGDRGATTRRLASRQGDYRA